MLKKVIKRNARAFLLIVSLGIVGGYAQTLTQDILLPACSKKESCGYINTKGNFIIRPQFLRADDFSEGLAAVKIHTPVGDRFGYIDTSGKIVIPAIFEAAVKFVAGMARIGSEVTKFGAIGRYGFIDNSGRIIISELEGAEDFSEDLAKVTISFPSNLPADQPGGKIYKEGFIDKRGKFVISPNFYIAKSFSEGLAPACIGSFRNSKCGFISPDGSWKIQPIFDSAESFSEGLAAVEINGSWGYIDKTGKIAIKPKFSVAKGFSEGLAAVGSPVDGTTYGYIDKTGMPMIPFIYASAGNFSDGLATVEPKGLDEFTVKYFYIDRQGGRNSKKEYIYASEFQNGIATVWKANFFARLDSGPLLGLAIGKRCYIDKSEKMFWEEKEH